MIFRTEVRFPDYSQKIKGGDQLIFLGSCFSGEMEPYFGKIGLKTLSNPFGVIFHPLALSRIIQEAISNEERVEVIQRGDLYFSWGSSGEIYAGSEEELIKSVNEKRILLREKLSGPNARLFLTFGTSFGYKLTNRDFVVANCHKQPGNGFKKELTDLKTLVESFTDTLEKLRIFNPDIKVFSSVSPVRHTKDGLRENNLSKARLLELTSFLETKQVAYIPAYELILDELRDYRFFEADLIHPNRVARDFLWEKLSEVLLDQSDLEMFKNISDYHMQLAHRTLYPDSKEELRRREQLEKRREELIRLYPEMHIK